MKAKAPAKSSKTKTRPAPQAAPRKSPPRKPSARKLARVAALVGVDTPPMEARTETELPRGSAWQFEPKWDGFRCLVFKDGDAVDLRAKSGKPLTRYFPEVAAFVKTLAVKRFVLDGELVIEGADGLSFNALQMRLHPAESRVRKLAAETPARLMAFDLLVAPDGARLLDEPLDTRRGELERLIKTVGTSDRLRLSPRTFDRAKATRWLGASGTTCDGVVAKRRDGSYQPGERSMVKVKALRSADCVVGGFRHQTGSKLVGSLLLGLYDEDGALNHVGFTSGIRDGDRVALTAKLNALRGPPGFTGRAPGGPSRWATERSAQWEPLKPRLVVEVRYDHVTDGRFRHGTALLRWRPDKAPRQCTFDQIARAGT